DNEKKRFAQKVYRDSKDFLAGLSFEKTNGLKTKKVDLDLSFKSGNEHGKRKV
ncbi:hypothetical protein LCGC14_2444440, partial [marine sediment metagenome]